MDLDLTDLKKFKAYANAVQDTVTTYGGRYTCRWGYPETLKGQRLAHLIAMIEVPTVKQARKWRDSGEYCPLKEM